MRLTSPYAFLRASCLPLLVLAASSPFGFALGTRVVDQGAEATARGEAFAATADNPSAIYYNPAGITQLRGTQVLLGCYAIEFNTRIDLKAGGGTFDNRYQPQAVPHFYATWQFEKAPITLGLGIYAPFGFSNKYSDKEAFRTLGVEGTITDLALNPVIAIKLTSTLSFAVGPSINYGQAKLVQGIFAPGDEFRFNGDDVSLGAHAGLLWQPHRMHSFGLNYFSPVNFNMEGHAHTQFDAFTQQVEVAPGVVVPFPVPGVDQRERATAKLHFPQHAVVGYSFRPTDDWNFEFNLDWTDWDNLNTSFIRKASGDAAVVFNWKSSFLYEFGVSKRFGDWKVSAGYVYSENSVPEESFNPLIPDSDRHIFSVGVGRKMDRWDWFLSYQHTWAPSRTIERGTLADGDYRFEANALNLSLAYRF